MAKAVKRKAKSDISIGVTGQLGRIDPDNPVDKLNCVWIAATKNDKFVFVREVHVPEAERRKQKEFIIDAVASMVLEII